MADEIKPVEQESAPGADGQQEGQPKEPQIEPSQDPVQKELQKVQDKKGKFTKQERLLFEKKKIEEQLAELGEKPPVDPTLDDSAPVTVAMLRKMEAEKATRTAAQLADDEIEASDERELTKHYLATRIIPSGDARKDFLDARALVNSLKNSQIIEEAGRKSVAKRFPSGASAPGKLEEAFEPTPEEALMMRAPIGLTKEQIIAARKAAQ